MLPDELKKIIQTNLPGAVVEIRDLTGAADHYEARVTSECFRGLSLIEQHQLVQKPLLPLINDGRLHALSIKTKLPN